MTADVRRWQPLTDGVTSAAMVRDPPGAAKRPSKGSG